MQPLIAAALRQRALTLLGVVVLAWAGLQAWLHLPIDAFPDISPTQAKIILKVPGMTPQEMEQRVVRPIEQELLGIPRQRIVRSVSKYGVADITLDFEEGTDLYWARQQVNERLSGVMADLPSGVSGGLAPITTPLSELYMFTVESPQHSLAERRRVLDWVIRPELRTVPGVAEVNSLGGEVRTFEVVPDPARLAALGLSLADLQSALQANNSNDGAGRISLGDEALVVRIEGAARNEADLRGIGLRVPGSDRPIRLDDVAQVRIGSLARQGAVTRDGQGETVQGLVLGLRGANARQLVTGIEARLDALRPRLPPGMEIRTFYNRADLVQRATDTVIKALAEAAVLVCVVLYLFLGGMRAAVVVALSLPLSMLSTFILMEQVGLTANLMSLGGLAIALGMLVDASVVVVENIETHLAQPRAEGEPPPPMTALILGAVGEVIRPVVSGVLIICVVFLPLLTLQDLEGKLFAPVAKTIVLALLSSLVVALLVVPTLASALLRQGTPHSRLVQRLERLYEVGRDAAWRHPRTMVAAALLALGAATGLLLQTGKTFMPTLDEGDLLVQLQKSPAISLETSVALDTTVQQRILAQVPEVASIVARVGADELGLDPMGLYETDTFLVLKPRDQWRGGKVDIVDALRRVFDEFPGLIVGFTQPIEMRVSEMLTGTRGDVAIKLFGHDLELLKNAAQQVAGAARQVAGAAEVIAPNPEGLPYLSIRVDRAKAAQAGLSVDAIQQALRQAVDGQTVGQVIEGPVRTPLQLRGGTDLRQSPQALMRWTLQAPDGRSWPLSALAAVETVEGPIRIDHEQGQRLTLVQVSVEGRDLSGYVADAQAAMQALGLPADIRITWGGQFENQQRAAARLALVVPMALTVIFVILTLTFGSARQALLIFLNIPFALVGGIGALWAAGEYLSVPASVGFIALLGIAVLNGVVMVSHFNERLAAGQPMSEVVREGSMRRLRPVLMTAVITALGMIPLLFATGPGSEIQRPLALVVSGGLVSSTLLTLLLLPWMFERWGLADGAQAIPSPHGVL